MIDLHLHLDGSLSFETVRELARMQNIALPQALRLSAPENCESLDAYLRCFEFPISLLQSVEAVEYAVYALGEELRRQGLIYAEVRFAPQLHCKNCTQSEIVAAALRGMNQTAFDMRLILCTMRGAAQADNLQTVFLAEQFLGQGVVGIDLAGAEGKYPTQDYGYVFSAARERNIPFTVHAGEASGADSVRFAIESGAARIGHGIRAFESDSVMELVRRNGIVMEMCPTSNFQTKAVFDAEAYPLKRWLESGVKVTVNTDNMTVSDTCISDEYRFIVVYGLTSEQRQSLLFNAADAAFLPSKQRAVLRQKICAAMKEQEKGV